MGLMRSFATHKALPWLAGSSVLAYATIVTFVILSVNLSQTPPQNSSGTFTSPASPDERQISKNEKNFVEEIADGITELIGARPTYSVAGQIEKGPLIYGSEVRISELDSNLVPNGNVFFTKTTDDLGRFSLSANLTSNLIEITGTGYYFDEIGGAISSSPITLTAVADLTVDPTPTLNILSTLQTPRLTELVRSGIAYSDASTQSKIEVLSSFGIDVADVVGFQDFYSMNLTGSEDPDSVLLAITSILSQAATNKTTTASPSQAAHMTVLLSQIARDIAETGTINDAKLMVAIASASSTVKLGSIRTNLENYYQDRGVLLSIPLFEEWIDKDNSGVLPQRRSVVEGISLTALQNQEAYAVVQSNNLSFAAIAQGSNIQVSVQDGVRIYKNNALVDGLFTTVNASDTLYLTTTTLGFGKTKKVIFNVGNGSLEWLISTKTADLIHLSKDSSEPSCLSGGISYGEAANWFAVPIVLENADDVKYAGIGVDVMDPSQSHFEYLSIYSDNQGQPGTELARSQDILWGAEGAYYNTGDQTDTRYFDSDSEIGCFARSTQGYFGSQGVSLLSNQTYWLVGKLDQADRYNIIIGPYKAGSLSLRPKFSHDGIAWSDFPSLSVAPGWFVAG